MTDAHSLSKARNRAGLRWALVPVGLLASSTLGVVWMAAIATRDPNFALERDYYQKAIHWDQTQAQAASNQRLGYQFVLPPRVTLDKLGKGSLELKIFDRSGQPLAGARVTAEAFPNAYSDDISRLSFSERAPGIYTAPITAQHGGLWEFRISLDSGSERATANLRCDLTRGGAA
jgi:nitrogen fixation protein FixH